MSHPLRLPRGSVLGRAIARHLRTFHSSSPTVTPAPANRSRRTFLGATAGAAGLAFWIPQPAHADEGKGKSADPRPIPGGVSPFGIFIHHFPAQLTAAPLQSLNDPSQITDFDGVVGLTRLRGAGIGTGFVQTLAYQADMGFMKGRFIAEDGNLHEGVFGFI